MTSTILSEKLSQLPEEPGVYLMKGERGEILYVGKAKVLKSRVSQYFQSARNLAPRTQLLVSFIRDLDVFITDNETEALILECNLIKRHRPRYNVRLKDDKSYPYVRMDQNHPFPRIEFVRRSVKDGAKYFGPFTSSGRLRELMGVTRRAFRLRDCSDMEFRNRARPCILYQMGQCTAPCVGLIDSEKYNGAVQKALLVLEGRTKEALGKLQAEMEQAAEQELFEDAAILRDQIQMLEQIENISTLDEQKILNPQSELNRDVVGIARDKDKAAIVILMMRDGSAQEIKHFNLKDLDPEQPDEQILFESLAQYYINRPKEMILPEEVLLPLQTDPQIAAEYLILSKALSRRVEFWRPQRGEYRELQDLSSKTAAQTLAGFSQRESKQLDDLQDLQRRLVLRTFPRRMECFDISHFQGEGTVASRVVFIDGKPNKDDYRRYHVRTVDQPDDFASMREILMRRFQNDAAVPDLVVVDGGKGQLSQLLAVLAELNITNLEVVGLAKARTKSNFEEQEVKASSERVFKPRQKNPILLHPGTGAYRMLASLRDEAHRFAINFHRVVRDRARSGS